MMHWYGLLSCTLVIFLSPYALCQQSDSLQKQELVKKGFELTSQLLQTFYKENNVIFSPFNIRVALALVLSGAEGSTRDEIAHLLGFPTDAKGLQQAHETLSQILNEIENTTEVPVFGEHGWKNEKGIIIKNANGVFVQEGIKLLPVYKSQVQSYYKGEATNVDFAKPAATDAINQFISKNTNGRIPKLFSEPLDPQTAIVLAATLYFKAAWNEPFNQNFIKDGTFDTGSGKVPVKLMQQTDDIPYINLASIQAEAIRLDYAGQDASIFFVLPNENQTLKAVVSALNGDILKEIAQKSISSYVEVNIPQTKYKWSEDIDNSLQKLGVKEVFGSHAKLSNLANQALRVSKVTHAAEIELNEKGTEASAVTVIQIHTLSATYRPHPPIPFHLTRPFLMFIYHHKTESVLFIGTVHNPHGSS